MYIPLLFEETDRETLCSFIEQNSFGVVLSQHNGEPFATHMPLLLERNAGPSGMLLGHFAKANPQWQQADGQSVLAVFSGPHAYVSPSWYEAENVVPTWNYAAVHVYGTYRAIDDQAELANVISRFVNFYESAMPKPWVFDAGSEFSKKMLQQVAGFRIEITRIEGKWKLNQNHPRERREKVIRALSASLDPQARATAELMKQQLAKS